MTILPTIRRVVLWRWNDSATPELKLRAKEGLAYIAFASRVHAVDFGEDLGLSGVTNYSLAFLRDHCDRESWEEYNRDPHHHRVGNFIDTLTNEALTVRADYLYKGPPTIRGRVRYLALYTWRAGVDERRKREARRAVAALRADYDGLCALEVADDLGWAQTGRADLVVEAHFADESDAGEFLNCQAYGDVQLLLDSLTLVNRTARIQYRMKSG